MTCIAQIQTYADMAGPATGNMVQDGNPGRPFPTPVAPLCSSLHDMHCIYARGLLLQHARRCTWPQQGHFQPSMLSVQDTSCFGRQDGVTWPKQATFLLCTFLALLYTLCSALFPSAVLCIAWLCKAGWYCDRQAVIHGTQGLEHSIGPSSQFCARHLPSALSPSIGPSQPLLPLCARHALSCLHEPMTNDTDERRLVLWQARWCTMNPGRAFPTFLGPSFALFEGHFHPLCNSVHDMHRAALLKGKLVLCQARWCTTDPGRAL